MHRLTRISLRGVISIATFFCLSVILIQTVEAAQPQPSASRVTAENYDKIKGGEGKLNEADVEAILGTPSRLTILEGGSIQMAWEDSVEVRVAIKDGKATEIQLLYSGHHPAAKDYAMRLKKLKPGMTPLEIRGVLGLPDGVARFPDPKQPDRTATWKRVNRIIAEFSQGTIKKRPTLQMNVLE